MKKPASRLVHPPAERILPQRFWSSDKLTGSQTGIRAEVVKTEFWSSDKLTGSQTPMVNLVSPLRFGAVTN